jgi:alpha/beta superfamily hydrolase
MIEEYVNFNSDGRKLEGIMSYDPDADDPPALLLCPPHPHLGGDMENNVITTLGNVLAEKGFVTLRFNYRGVGKSESEFDNIADKYNYWENVLSNDDYADALADTTSALGYLESAIDTNKSFVVGYSFGAVAAMMLSVKNINIRAFVLISTPFGRFDPTLLAGCIKPKLIICADNDFASSIENVKKGMLNIPDPKGLEIFENCDHFYIDKEHIIADKVHEFFISQ